ncbi:tigger transposable element-derived 1-like [Pelobates cultripes]|uniref:Tigger transposable element-derived 1-like n=1 Tax=Pelobates cultripes TaxID=61616 RepID=A0AAD1TM63_PELCU|nr:tigger transposable element-derived 1-like [Pelobates cultripes]
MKDRLILLFCANASGDLKIKPLLVYHSEKPWAFKKHKVNKEQLSVLWQSNPKAWVTRLLFVQWVNVVFGHAVKQYLVDNNLPLTAMLLTDCALAHPPGLEEDLLEDLNFIKVMFLPPNTTPLLQPMDQQVIPNFKKKLYTRELFRRWFERTDRSSLTLHEFWREHFDIVSCLQIITIACARLCCETCLRCFCTCTRVNSVGGDCFLGEDHGPGGD